MSIATHLFPRHLFPIDIEALHADTRAVVWSKHVEAPGSPRLVHIPALAKELGHPVIIRCKWGDGTESEMQP